MNVLHCTDATYKENAQKRLAIHTSPWVYILGTASVIGIKVSFFSRQVNSTKGNFEHMTSFFMSDFSTHMMDHTLIVVSCQRTHELCPYVLESHIICVIKFQ